MTAVQAFLPLLVISIFWMSSINSYKGWAHYPRLLLLLLAETMEEFNVISPADLELISEKAKNFTM